MVLRQIISGQLPQVPGTIGTMGPLPNPTATSTTGPDSAASHGPAASQTERGHNVFRLYNGTDGMVSPFFMSRTFDDGVTHYR